MVCLFAVLSGFQMGSMTAVAEELITDHRTRRIIINDDGGVRLPEDGKDWDRYLGERLRLAAGTQADSYFQCVAATSHEPEYLPGLVSTMSHWAANKKTPAIYDEATRRLIDAARQTGLEVFASVRLNDTHDRGKANVEALTYPLKNKRPDLLLGNADSMERGAAAYPQDSVMHWFWPGLNWGQAEVRQHFLDFIRWFCSRQDFDGLELDYYRHPLFFRLGEEEQHTPAMTEFVRQVRETLSEIGRQRSRPYLLAIRVPDTPAIARRSGLDVETWLREGLIDLLIVGGGYMPYSGRLKEFVDLAHEHKVDAYPCVNHCRGPVKMRGLASNFQALGGDGFYLFNFTRVTGRAVVPEWGIADMISLHEIGSAETLHGKEKTFLADTGERRFYIGYSNLESQFPVSILGGRAAELFVGDDVGEAEKDGSLKELRLEVSVAGVAPGEQIAIKLNGVAVPPKSITRAGETEFKAFPAAALVRRGVNDVSFAPGIDSPGHLDSQVTGLKLVVQYK